MNPGARRGVRIGVDVGKVRVGVARSDPDGILASPLVTLARDLPPAGGTARGRTGPARARPAGPTAAGGPTGAIGPTAAGGPTGPIGATAAGGRTDPAGTGPASVPDITESSSGGAEGTGRAGGGGTPADIAQLAALVREHEAVEVVVGLPVTLAGREALAAADARGYAELLGREIEPVPVRLSDERMTTVVASRRLSERGVRGRRQRAVVDQVAAVEILQGWLDNQRRRTQ
jgi:putative Holliday junction resolvase